VFGETMPALFVLHMLILRPKFILPCSPCELTTRTSTTIWTMILIMTMMKASINPYLDYNLLHEHDENLHQPKPGL
jgi:hypothetical protein